MMANMYIPLASFTMPEHIATDPKSVLWLYPLLLSITIIYKATKMQVIFPRKFIREIGILFCTLSVLMTAVGAGLVFLTWLLT